MIAQSNIIKWRPERRTQQVYNINDSASLLLEKYHVPPQLLYFTNDDDHNITNLRSGYSIVRVVEMKTQKHTERAFVQARENDAT